MFPLLLFLLLLLPPSLGQPCTARSFSKNRLFSTCIKLPHLAAYLHYTFDPSNSTLALAFAAPSTGWVAWGIGEGMVGAQALIAFHRPDGSVAADTFNITAYGPVKPSPIAFDTWGLEAEEAEDGGVMGIFATVKLPPGVTRLNQVWQVGPMGSGGVIGKHGFGPENLQAVAVLDVVNGKSSGSVNVNTGLSKRNMHGILNAVSWGIMLPIGGMLARWLKTFKAGAPAWFYLHVSCQLIGYIVGVAGWGTGLNLGSKSKGITHTTHRNIGIALFCLATLQVFALFLRPKKEHKYRIYWNAYHHMVGYVVIILGVLNVFRGLRILNPGPKWLDAYIVVICSLAVIAIMLEVGSWISVSRSQDSRKPSDGYNTTVGHAGEQHQPLSV